MPAGQAVERARAAGCHLLEGVQQPKAGLRHHIARLHLPAHDGEAAEHRAGKPLQANAGAANQFVGGGLVALLHAP